MYSFAPPALPNAPHAALHRSLLLRVVLWVLCELMCAPFILMGAEWLLGLSYGGAALALGLLFLVAAVVLLFWDRRMPESVIFDDGAREVRLFRRRVREPRDLMSPDARLPYAAFSRVDLTRRVSTSTSNGRTSRSVHWDVHLTKEDGARWVLTSLSSERAAHRLLEQLAAHTQLHVELPPRRLHPAAELEALLARAGGPPRAGDDDDLAAGALSPTSALAVRRDGERLLVTWEDRSPAARLRRALFVAGWAALALGLGLVGSAGWLGAALCATFAYAALRVALRGGAPGRVEVGPEGVTAHAPAGFFSSSASRVTVPHAELAAVKVSPDLTGRLTLWRREELEAQLRLLTSGAEGSPRPAHLPRRGLLEAVSEAIADTRVVSKVTAIDASALHACDLFALEGLVESAARRFGAEAR